MSIDEIIQHLMAERARIDAALEALQGTARPASGKAYKAARRATGPLISCTYKGCEHKGTLHGLKVHIGKKHKANVQIEELPKRKRSFNTKPYSTKPPAFPVCCIDCGEGPFNEVELMNHLRTCEAYQMADRSTGNGRH